MALLLKPHKNSTKWTCTDNSKHSERKIQYYQIGPILGIQELLEVFYINGKSIRFVSIDVENVLYKLNICSWLETPK